MGVVLEHHLSFRSHAVDDSSISIIDDKKLIFFFIALLHKAHNVDPMNNAGHKLGDEVTLYYAAVDSVGEDPDLPRFDL